MRHTQACVYMAERLCRAFQVTLMEHRDIVMASALLHDIGKAIAEPHEVVAYVWLMHRIKKDDPDRELLLQIAMCVRWHNGIWSFGAVEGKHEPGKVGWSDLDLLAQVVHMADYAVAQRRFALIPEGEAPQQGVKYEMPAS